MNSSHERPYGIGLLDDLHTFFPAILYTPDVFNTTQDLLQYISSQAREHFNIYSRNLRSFLNQDMRPVEVQTNSNQTAFVPRLVGGIPIETYRRQVASQLNSSTTSTTRAQNRTTAPEITSTRIRYTTTPITLSTTEDTTGLSSLNALLSLLQPNSVDINMESLLTPLMTPVRVAPTREQIRGATSLRMASANDVNMCSICQEHYETNDTPDTICVINHCQHGFHNSCLMRWFDENTRCPVCRWDIREDTRSTQTGTQTSSPQTNS
jgi:hypothetical protein